jgi:hypothetical protein
MEPYTHSRFDLERPGLRLLQLRKGTGSTIQCELFQAWLDDEFDDLMPYEALSYTWGGTELSNSVQIDGKSLGVTHNLYLALQHLRSEDEDRILWIDAMCIDQSDLKERGHQVAQMGQIYSRAERVVIWLGPSTEDIDFLLGCLKELERSSTKEWHQSYDRWSEGWSRLQAKFKVRYWLCVSRQRAGLQSLLDYPWFKRVWIIQEVANAKKARICSGNKFVMAHTFVMATKLMNMDIGYHCKAILDIMPGVAREESWWGTRRDLSTLLEKFGQSEATDPRDKIYALLGICSDDQNHGGLSADYTRDVNQVVRDVALTLFGLHQCPEDYTVADLQQYARACNNNTLELLVEHTNQQRVGDYLQCAESLGVTSDILAKAANNIFWGKDVVARLLEFTKMRATVVAMEAAFKNTRSGKDIPELLFSIGQSDFVSAAALCSLDILGRVLEGIGYKTDVTCEIIIALVTREKRLDGKDWDLFFQKPEFRETFQEEIIPALAQYNRLRTRFWKPMLAQLGSRISITEQVIKEVVRDGPDVLDFLIEQRGLEIELTPKLAVDTLENNPFGAEMLGRLCENERSKTERTQGSSRMGKMMVSTPLAGRRVKIRLTGDTVMCHIGSKSSREALIALFREQLLDIEVTYQALMRVKHVIILTGRTLNNTGRRVTDHTSLIRREEKQFLQNVWYGWLLTFLEEIYQWFALNWDTLLKHRVNLLLKYGDRGISGDLNVQNEELYSHLVELWRTLLHLSQTKKPMPALTYTEQNINTPTYSRPFSITYLPPLSPFPPASNTPALFGSIWHFFNGKLGA